MKNDLIEKDTLNVIQELKAKEKVTDQFNND